MRVTITKSDLPPVGDDGSYLVRTRVVSDSRNATSFWSPAYKVALIEGVGGFVNAAISANVYQKRIGASEPTLGDTFVNQITATWSDDNGLPSYDVYAKWYTIADGWSEYAYLTTVSSREYTFSSPQPDPYVQDDTLTEAEQEAAEAAWVAAWPNKLARRVGVAVTRSTFKHNYLDSMVLFNTDSMPYGGVVLG